MHLGTTELSAQEDQSVGAPPHSLNISTHCWEVAVTLERNRLFHRGKRVRQRHEKRKIEQGSGKIQSFDAIALNSKTVLIIATPQLTRYVYAVMALIWKYKWERLNSGIGTLCTAKDANKARTFCFVKKTWQKHSRVLIEFDSTKSYSLFFSRGPLVWYPWVGLGFLKHNRLFRNMRWEMFFWTECS